MEVGVRSVVQALHLTRECAFLLASVHFDVLPSLGAVLVSEHRSDPGVEVDSIAFLEGLSRVVGNPHTHFRVEALD